MQVEPLNTLGESDMWLSWVLFIPWGQRPLYPPSTLGPLPLPVLWSLAPGQGLEEVVLVQLSLHDHLGGALIRHRLVSGPLENCLGLTTVGKPTMKSFSLIRCTGLSE